MWKGNWGEKHVGVKKLFTNAGTPEVCSHSIKIYIMVICVLKDWQTLANEFNIAAQLLHPNVVLVYGACHISPIELWIVMEYAVGGSLNRVLCDSSKVRLDTNSKDLQFKIRLFHGMSVGIGQRRQHQH